jgi:hypothetical protein
MKIKLPTMTMQVRRIVMNLIDNNRRFDAVPVTLRGDLIFYLVYFALESEE